jgi:putative Holliday junction resolvase
MVGRIMIRTLPELRSVLAPGLRLLGLDVGSKTIGMAVSDPGLVVASPIGTVRRTKFNQDARELARAVREYGAGGLVLGLPLNMDGSEGPRVQSVRQFAASLMNAADVFGGEPEITFWDERLSTSAVERFMIREADMSRKRRDEVVDKMAAAYILQGALDALAYQAQAAQAQAAQDQAAQDQADQDD